MAAAGPSPQLRVRSFLRDTLGVGDKDLLVDSVAKGLSGEATVASLHWYWIPGRIEFLGKHTDYCGGNSLLCAVNRGFIIAIAPSASSNNLVIKHAKDDSTFTFDINGSNEDAQQGHWSQYFHCTWSRLRRDYPSSFAKLGGFQAVFASDLPRASGMSSSSALVVAAYLLAINANSSDATHGDNPLLSEMKASGVGAHDLVRGACGGGTSEGQPSSDSLFSYLGCCENGAGTFGGSEDHTAILGCQPGHLSHYSFCPTRFQSLLKWPEGFMFIIASSGVEAEKTMSKLQDYNDAVTVMRSGKEVLTHDPNSCLSLADVLGRKSEEEVLSKFDESKHSKEAGRVKHFMREQGYIKAVVAAFKEYSTTSSAQKIVEALDTIKASQENGASLLHNQTKETVRLCEMVEEIGREEAGGMVAVASAFGAGFGGSVYCMYQRVGGGEEGAAAAESFMGAWKQRYLSEFPEYSDSCDFFIVDKPMPGAVRVC